MGFIWFKDRATFAIRPIAIRAAWEARCTRREDPRQPAISDMIYPRNIWNINAGGSEKLASPTGHYGRYELSSRPGRNIIRRVRNILRKSNTDDRQLTRQKAPLARRKSP